MKAQGLALGSLLLCFTAAGDQIEMRNGDHYVGRVLALTNQTLILQSEVLGILKLPQPAIATIAFGPRNVGTNGVGGAFAPTNSQLSTAVGKLKAEPTAADAVKQQLLSGADPAAKAKFDSMLNDLMTGKLSMTDLQGQARSAATTIKELKQQLGSEADPALDGYLAVLEGFLRESLPTATPGPAAQTNSLPAKSSPGVLGDDN